MEEKILEKLEQQSEKLDKIYASAEKTRKYFLWTLVITLITIILPLVGLVIVIPKFLSAINPNF